MGEVQRVVRARNVRVLPRTQDIMPNGLGVGMQVWRDTNRNRLLARFASARNKGYVTEVTPIKFTSRGDYVKVVKVLRRPPRRAPWYAFLVVAAMGTSVSIGLAVWHARFIILAALGTLAGIAFLVWLGTRVSHSGACVGIHCAGCRYR